MIDRGRAFGTEILIVPLAVTLTLGAVATVFVRFREPSSLPDLPVVGVFFLAVVIGELFRITLPDDRHPAPIATAAALAFAMTTNPTSSSSASYPAALVVAVAAVAMAAGSVPSVIRSRAVRPSDLASRLVGIAVAALLFRDIPISHGRTVLDLEASWPPYFLALVMVVVSVLALAVEVFLLASVRAARSHAPFLRTLKDEFLAASGLAASLSATGALIALAERPLGTAAVPLFLFPLVLMQFAIRRQSAIHRTYRQTLRTMSRLTEVIGLTESGHAARVAKLSKALGRELGMSERDVLDLEYAALLHDIGQVSLAEPIPGGATVLAAPADQRRIAHDGAEIVRASGVLDKVAVILEAQTTPYVQVRRFGADLPLSSRIIKVCNAYDDLAGGTPSSVLRDTAIERIHLGLGYEYDPRVVDALIRVLAHRDQ